MSRMAQVWQLFIRDCGRVLRNPAALLISIGVIILPSLYAWFNIAANWDPYGRTESLKVAVVSLDEGTEFNGFKLRLGDKIEEKLKVQGQIGWQFPEYEEALQGVADGSYYAAVIIPEHFSEDLTSAFTSRLQRPSLRYLVNEKRNAIATKITDKGAQAIQENINESFWSTVSETVSTALRGLSGTVEEDSRLSVDQLSETLDKGREDIGALKESLGILSSSLESSKAMLEGMQALGPDKGALQTVLGQTLAKTSELGSQTGLFADSLSEGIGTALAAAQETGELAAGQLNLIGGQAELSAQAAAERLERIDRGLRWSLERLQAVSQVLQRLKAALGFSLPERLSRHMEDKTAKLQQACERVEQLIQTLKAGAALSASDRETLSLIADSLSDESYDLYTEYLRGPAPALQSALSALQAGLVSAGDSLQQSAALLPRMDKSLQSTAEALQSQLKALEHAQSVLDTQAEHLSKTREKLQRLSHNEQLKMVLEVLQNDPEEVKNFWASPVELKTEKLYPVQSYGAAMTPFYTTLCLWVGGLVLAAIYRTGVREDERLRNLKPYQTYLSRGMFLSLLSMLQGLVVGLGDIFLFGLRLQMPAKFLLACVVGAFVFNFVIYTLNVCFGDIGKAIAVIILVLQVAGSGGTYPVELTPEFFRILNPLLPFTHLINAMRECIAGPYGHYYGRDMLMTLAYLPPALLMGLALRRFFVRMNHWMEHRLEETEMM